MKSADLPKSRRVMLLVDFINPMDFPEASKLASFAVDAGIPVIYANDKFGNWS